MNLITSLAMKVMGMGSLTGKMYDAAAAAINSSDDYKGYTFLLPVIKVVDNALLPILICVIAAGTIYSVILGINMAKADSSDKREEAKKRLINAIVGFGIIVVLLAVLYALAWNITSILGIAENAGVVTAFLK